MVLERTAAAAGPRPRAVELTHAQQMIWAGQQMSPGTPLYNMARTFTIDGPLDPAAFRAALQAAVDASDALSSVVRSRDGRPERVVVASLDCDLEVIDVSGRDDPDRAAWEYAEERARAPLDLGVRLFETALLKVTPERHVWFLNQHHLVADAWSMNVLYRHVADGYAAIEQGRTPRPEIRPYEELLRYERSEPGAGLARRAREFWAERVAEAAAAPSLYGAARRHPSTRTTRVSRALGADRSEALRDATRRPPLRALSPEATVFNVFATCLMAWMWRVSGQSQLGLGTLAHNRATQEHQDIVGVFIELFPLLARVEEGDTFASLNERMRTETLRLLRHAHPGASLAEAGRTFNVVLNYTAATPGDFVGRPVATDWVHCGHGDEGHHLRVQVRDHGEPDGFTVHFDFNEAVFGARRREFAIEHILRLLDALLADPAAPLASVPLPGEEEQRLLLEAAHAAAAPPAEGTAVSRFAARARAHPGRTAVVTAAGDLTYAELDERSDRLARVLLEAGTGPDAVVALCAERSPDMVVGMLGIQKAGAAYLPIAPGDPAERRRLMLRDSGAVAAVVHEPTAALLDAGGLPVVRVDRLPEPAAPGGPLPDVAPHHLAYVVFTSGSTGTPKPPMLEHRNLVSLVDGLHERIYGPHLPADGGPLRVALVAPYVFDPSVQQIFGALLGGHTLHVVPEDARVDGDLLFDYLADNLVDIADGTPGHLRLLADGSTRDLDELAVRHFVIGGEAMPKALVRRFLGRYKGPAPAVTNAYGPAECCVDCVVWQVADGALDDHATVPIGTPLPGELIYIVDDGEHLAPFGAIGEICIGGGGVGRGYLGDPALTAARFVPNPFAPGTMYRTGDLARQSLDGVIEFAGRKDDQVKVRGHRVELGEVESALKQFRVTRAHIPLAPAEAAEPRRCERCLLHDRHPGVTLDAAGVCSVCREFEVVQHDVLPYFRPIEEFAARMDRARELSTGDYDCLLLYSGGKDSSYVLYRLAEMGLRVLAYTFDNGHISPAAFRNIERQTAKLGVDSIVTGAARMDEIFLESLTDDATVCSGCFKSLTTISTRLAHEQGIPAVLTGLSRGQIFDTKLAGLMREGVRDVADFEEKLRLFRHAYHANRDRAAMLLDVDVDGVDLDGIDFVDYFRYDATPTAGVHAYLRERDQYWQQPEDTGFCSSNCRMNDVGIAVHTATRGFHNYEAPLSWDVRLGTTTRERALDEIAPVRNVRYVNRVLDRVGYTTREIRDAAVVPREDADGSRQLWAFYVASQTLTVAELRAFLSRTLPEYMIPARFFQVDEIPLTPNGKVDRDRLEPDARRPELGTAVARPTSAAEHALAGIWAEVLGLDEVGVHDNYFELGGDSIVAIQVVARAAAQGWDVTPRQLFDRQTVRSLAAVARPRAPEAPGGLEEQAAASPAEFSMAALSPAEVTRLAELLDG